MTEVAPLPLSLYVHLPWCVRKCPYCDFNSHERREALPEAQYVSALVADLEGMLPIVYTPAVGRGCEQFSQSFRKPVTHPY